MAAPYCSQILRKGVAVHTLVIIIMMAMFAVVSFYLLYYFSEGTGTEANQTTCMYKRIAFCTEWSNNKYGTEPWTWDDRDPQGCEEFDIVKPSVSDCQSIV
jgi:hypothetical protein